MISEIITFRVTKAKAEVKFGVKYLCEHERERSSVPINTSMKAKATKYLGGVNFTLICVAMVFLRVDVAFGSGGKMLRAPQEDCQFEICVY